MVRHAGAHIAGHRLAGGRVRNHRRAYIGGQYQQSDDPSQRGQHGVRVGRPAMLFKLPAPDRPIIGDGDKPTEAINTLRS